MPVGRHRRVVRRAHRSPGSGALLVFGALVATCSAVGASVAPAGATPDRADSDDITVTSPADGATVTDTVTLQANVTVRVKHVTWEVDGRDVGTEDESPWTVSWDSRSVSDGTHRITAVADTESGSDIVSAPVSVTVRNVASSSPCGHTSSPPATYDHVVWIVFENHSYDDIVGNSRAPYLNQLAAQCGSATDMHAETHPSLPNYIAMTSGSTQGITDDNPPADHPLASSSIFSQVGDWRSLEESMPTPCDHTDSGLYAVRHNPATYYVGLASSCPSLDVPLGSTPSIGAKFTFITPNLCNDMHDCGAATGDAWLSHELPAILDSAAYQSGGTAIFITWDEDDRSSDNHIPTFVIAPSVRPGTAVSTPFTHYSMLRTTEELLGISTYLRNAADATSMRAAFGL